MAQLSGAVEYTDCISAEGKDSPNECPRYDTKQFDVEEAPVMLKPWGMRRTHLLRSLPGPLWPGVVAPDKVLFMSQIELKCVLMLNGIVWNRTVYMYKNGFGIKKSTMVDMS